MKFTVLSHAGLLVESGDCSVLIDPWLVGSCYWRSWFNLPEPAPALIDGLAPDYIYITHLHWDHFHGPSLRRFRRCTPILIPRIPSTRMVRDLRYLGFSDIREIPHGGTVDLGVRFALHSFQFDPIATDSVVALEDDDTTLLDANDCKCFGLTLQQVKRRLRRIDFVLRSHSSAMPVPYCVEDYEENFGDIRTQDDYRREFAAFAQAVGARYAIPFASNHCFLHPQTRHFNDTAVLPDTCAAYMNADGAAKAGDPDGPRCVVMPSGSSWTRSDGFDIHDFDYAKRADYMAELSHLYADKLADQLRRETAARGDFDAFKAYFEGLLGAACWALRRWLPAAVFVVEEAGCQRFWRVDFRARRVEEVAEDAVCADDLRIAVPALVLNDCCRKRMFSAWTPSKRLRIRLGAATLNQLALVFRLLDLHEHERLPLRRLFGWRSLTIWRRRWREPVDLLSAFVKLKLKHLPVRSLYET